RGPACVPQARQPTYHTAASAEPVFIEPFIIELALAAGDRARRQQRAVRAPADDAPSCDTCDSIPVWERRLGPNGRQRSTSWRSWRTAGTPLPSVSSSSRSTAGVIWPVTIAI